MNPAAYDLYVWPRPGGTRSEAEKVASAPRPMTYDTSLPFLVKRAAEFVVGLSGFEKVAAAENLNIWRDPEAHPMVLLMMLLDAYGDECMEWDAEVLRVTLFRDGRQPTSSVWTKIQAARVLINSPSPWRQWEVFHWISLALAGEPPNFIYLEQADIGHLGAAVDMMKMIDPDREFSDEIDKFVAATIRHDGFPWAPPPLTFAQKELEEAQLRCLECSAIQRDDDDITCVTCGSTRLEAVPYEFAELRDEVAKFFTDYVDLPLSAAEELPETAAGISAYALLEKWEYVENVRLRLARQIKALKT